MDWKRWIGAAGLALSSLACSAGAEPIEGERTAAVAQALGEQVSTDKASYQAGETVTVTFAGFPGNVYDWVALAPAGSPMGSYVAWKYTGGAAAGTLTFGGAAAGSYVVRGFEDNGFTLLAESAVFEVQPVQGNVTLSLDKTQYRSSEQVTVGYSGMASYPNDWISIAPQGSPANAYVRWAYTGAKASGTHSFPLNGLTGTFVARAHFNNGMEIEAESAPFTVGAPATTIATDKSTYALGEVISITFSGMLGDKYDWISLAPAGSSVQDYSWARVTRGLLEGTVATESRDSPPPGTWVARAYFAGDYTLAAESAAFTVTEPSSYPVTLSTDKSAYSGLEPVKVTFSGMEGNIADWVGVAYPTATTMHHYAWTYCNSQVSGTVELPPVYAGTWEVRAFFDNGFAMQGRSAQFTVSAAVATDKPSYAAGEPVVARFGGMAGWDKDWLGLSVAGSNTNTFERYVYTSGEAAGTRTFDTAGLAPGSYVIRTYFDDSLKMESESAPFTIQ